MTDAQFTVWLKNANTSLRCVLVEVIARISGVETTLYLSSKNYTTTASDTPATTSYVACIAGGLTSSEELSLNGQPSISFGDIEIDNTGGVRDAWLGYVWANRRVRVYMGDPRWIRSDFRQIFEGVVDDIDPRDSDVLNLRFLDKMQRLNNPISETLLGGSTANKGQLLPLTFGECFNVTPLLRDPATLEYQYHNGAAERNIEVRSSGAVPVTVTDTLTTGRFTLGVAPAGTQITCSVQGDKVSGVYANDIVTAVKRIATAYGPAATRFAAGDLDTASLATFATGHTQAIGLYVPERLNQLDAMQQLAASVGAQTVVTTLGLLRLVQIALPGVGTTYTVGKEDISYHTLKVAGRVTVKASVKIGFCKNWTPQETVAGGVPVASAGLYKDEWLTYTASDATTATNYNLDIQPQQEDSLLISEVEAQTEATRRLTLWKTPRTIYSMEGRAHLLLIELGDTLTLTHARFGLSGGISGLVIRIQRDWLNGRIMLGVLA